MEEMVNAFNGILLSEYLQKKKKELEERIQNIPLEIFKKHSKDDLISVWRYSYKCDPLKIDKAARRISIKDIDRPFTPPNPENYSACELEPTRVTRVTVTYPYTGNRDLFKCVPDQYILRHGKIILDGSSVTIEIETQYINEETATGIIDEHYARVFANLDNVNQQVIAWNAELDEFIINKYNIKAQRIQELNDLAERLGGTAD